MLNLVYSDHQTTLRDEPAFSIAQEGAPAILFFDEISGLVPNRKRRRGFGEGYKEEEINEFLIQLNDAADKNVLGVGATNYIDSIDPAILRPGRFDKKITSSLRILRHVRHCSK